jgi:hypothetical protein
VLRVDTRWKFLDLQAVILENDTFRVVVLPEAGAKIFSIYHKQWNQEMLWHNPRVEPTKYSVGASYDDTWAGGWDDLFPNDAPEVFEGEAYVDHGELWNGRWNYEVEQDDQFVTVRFTRLLPITPVKAEKTLRLAARGNKLVVDYRLENLSGKTFKYLWKIHPAVYVEAGYRIELPAGRVEVDPAFPARVPEVAEYQWPYAVSPSGEKVDMREVLPASAGVTELQYATELRDGWCAVVNPRTNRGFGLAFDKHLFSTVWTFAVYGGWRGLHTVVLEPCTTYPYLLSEAVKRGRYAELPAHSTVFTTVTAVVFEADGAIKRIEKSGTSSQSKSETTREDRDEDYRR